MSVFIVGQSALASFFKLVLLLIAFILILVASYYVTKWYAKSGFVKKQTTNMEVIDTYSMGPNRQICIMRIGQKYIAVSVCKEHIRFLTEIPEEQLELPEHMPQEDTAPFKDVFKDMLGQQFSHGKKK